MFGEPDVRCWLKSISTWQDSPLATLETTHSRMVRVGGNQPLCWKRPLKLAMPGLNLKLSNLSLFGWFLFDGLLVAAFFLRIHPPLRSFSFRYESQPKKDVPSSDLTFSGHTNLPNTQCYFKMSLGDVVSSFVKNNLGSFPKYGPQVFSQQPVKHGTTKQ